MEQTPAGQVCVLSPCDSSTLDQHDAVSIHHGALNRHGDALNSHHDAASGHHDAASSHHDAASSRHDAASSHLDALSCHHDALCSCRDALSSHHDAASSHHDASSYHDATSNHLDALSSHHDALSSHHDAASSHHDAASSHHDAASSHHDAASNQHDSASSHLDAASTHHDAASSIDFSDDSSVSFSNAVLATAATRTISPLSSEAASISRPNPSTSSRRDARRSHQRRYSKRFHPVTSSDTFAEDRQTCSRRPVMTSSKATNRSSVSSGPFLTHAAHYFCSTDNSLSCSAKDAQRSYETGYCMESMRGTRCSHCSVISNALSQSAASSVPTCRCCNNYVCLCPNAAQVIHQPCQNHSRHTVCYAHNCHCQRRSRQTITGPVAASAPWPIPQGSQGASSYSYHSATANSPPASEHFCGRTKRGVMLNPTTSTGATSRKKHLHLAPASGCDCHNNCWIPQQMHSKAVKSTKSRSKEQRVQARRIRHPPCEDSNSESELGGPVIDVRALRTSSSRLSALSFPLGPRKPSYQRSTSQQFQITSSTTPATVGSPKIYSCPRFFQVQSSPEAISATSNGRAQGSQVSGSPREASRNAPIIDIPSSSSSSEGNGRSGSSTYIITDLSEPSSSNENDFDHDSASKTPHTHAAPYIYPCVTDPAASTSHSCSHHNYHSSHVHNPVVHGYYSGHSRQCVSNTSNQAAAPAMPISSGDFLTVHRGWSNGRGAKCAQRTTDGSYAPHAAHEQRRPVAHETEWEWVAQPLIGSGRQRTWDTTSGCRHNNT